MSAFESDDHSFSALLLVSPVLVQTDDRGEVEAKAGEYLVVTAAGRQMVMTMDELQAHMREPHDDLVAPVEEVPPVRSKKGSFLGRLRPGREPDRVRVSVTEEGFQEVSPPGPEPMVEEPAAQVTEGLPVEPEKKGVFSSLLGARGLGGRLGGLVSKVEEFAGIPVDLPETPSPDEEPAGTGEGVGIELDTELPEKEASEPEPDAVEPVVAEPPPELELELDAEEDGMDEILEDLVVRSDPAPRVPEIADPPVRVSESLLDLSDIKCKFRGLFSGKRKPTAGVRMPFAPKGTTKRPDSEICHNLPPVPVPGEAEAWDPFVPLSDEANRDLARLERAALANIEPPAEPKRKARGFGGFGNAPAGKKGKKKMVLPFQKKAAAPVEPKKKRFEWVPIDWI